MFLKVMVEYHNAFFVNNGVHCVSVKKSIIDTSLKKTTASMVRTKIIPKVTAIVINALVKSDFSITSSLILRIKLILINH